MSKEKLILISSWLVTCITLIGLVPKNKIRKAHVAFLFQQVITWLLGLLVVKFNLIRYPERFFKKSNKASFTFEYFIFPSVAVFFNLFYPDNKNATIKFIYYSFYLSLLTGLELFAERYTKAIQYINWKWYISTISIGLTLFLSRIYIKWFFKYDY